MCSYKWTTLLNYYFISSKTLLRFAGAKICFFDSLKQVYFYIFWKKISND